MIAKHLACNLAGKSTASRSFHSFRLFDIQSTIIASTEFGNHKNCQGKNFELDGNTKKPEIANFVNFLVHKENIDIKFST